MTLMAPPPTYACPEAAVVDGDCAHARCQHTCWLPYACPVVEKIGTLRSFRPGDPIFWEGDRSGSYFLIESGVGRGCRILSDGRRQICRFVFPGDLIAHSRNDTYPYTAEAITPISAYVIPRGMLQKKTESLTCMRKLLMDSLLAELRESQDQILVLGRMTAVERVSHFFYLLAERSGTDPSQPIIIPMNRTDIADYLGLTLETVSRVIGRLKREGTIRLISANRIAVHAPDLLNRDVGPAAA